MANTTLLSVNFADTISAVSSTRYLAMGGSSVLEAETTNFNKTSFPFRTAGTVSGMIVHVTANTVADAWTLAFGCVDSGSFVAGNQNVTIPALTTGTFEDNTNSDTVTPVSGSVGTLWTVRALRGAGSFATTTTIQSIGFSYDTGGHTNIFRNYDETAASTDSFWPVCGAAASWASTSLVSRSSITMPVAGTFRNPSIRVPTNTRNGDTVWTLMLNGVASGVTLTVPSTSTGFFYASGSVAVAVDDEICWQRDVQGSSGSMTYSWIAIEFEADDETHILAGGGSGGGGLNLGAPPDSGYVPVAGHIEENATLTTFEAVAPAAFQAANLGVHFTTTGHSVKVTLYIDGVASALAPTLTATANNQWVFSSTTLVPIARGDKLVFEFESVGGSAVVIAYQLNGVADVTTITGSAVFGVTTTVTATRAIAFGLDDAVNVHDEAGKFKVFGDFEVTGETTLTGAMTFSLASLESIFSRLILTEDGELILDEDGNPMFSEG